MSSSYMQSMITWLRAPALVSSGLAVLVSSLLYFKQKSESPSRLQTC
jgi:hypothetical protein